MRGLRAAGGQPGRIHFFSSFSGSVATNEAVGLGASYKAHIDALHGRVAASARVVPGLYAASSPAATSTVRSMDAPATEIVTTAVPSSSALKYAQSSRCSGRLIWIAGESVASDHAETRSPRSGVHVPDAHVARRPVSSRGRAVGGPIRPAPARPGTARGSATLLTDGPRCSGPRGESPAEARSGSRMWA